MNTTQLELETVTPMFLHGHDNMIVELRPPPFKALFRYWWRTVQDCDWESLQKNEAKLFGSTDGKSPFSLRISGTTDLGPTKEYSPLPHKGSAKRHAYDIGKSFNLGLITKNASDASSYKRIAKLGFLLGGIGTRSRRGFGSLRETAWNFPDVQSLQEEVLDTLNSLADSSRFQMDNGIIELKPRPSSLPKYPVIQLIGFGKPTDLKSLLKKIGQATHNHKDDALGYARGKKRLASPIHVRVQKVGEKYLPIATLLPTDYPRDPSGDLKTQLRFIAEIIK